MKRFKRHNVKTEAPESSTSHKRDQEVHDLAYYIHDRVELMHQVFSVLKYKDLKDMAPLCVRNISSDDLQELCTEELLGISSKRLCAILDGAEPPSDTESSSPSPPPELETISLDSISSDEEILSQSSKKKKHKHRRRDSKKRKRSKDRSNDEADGDRSKASRAGLTVLELLELQARARAIRAQLQKEQPKPQSESVAEVNSSDNEVEIKEEPAEVVEISSDEEKPKIEDLEKGLIKEKELEQQPSAITKRVHDLIVTVPQKTTKKIKLNRPKTSIATEVKTVSTHTEITIEPTKTNQTQTKQNIDDTNKNKKEKIKKKKKVNRVRKEDDDNDEITLQLSETEKMDLLEDLDRKTLDNVSTDMSSDSSSDDDSSKKEEDVKEERETPVNGSNDTEKVTEIQTESSNDFIGKVIETQVVNKENNETDAIIAEKTEENINADIKQTEIDKPGETDTVVVTANVEDGEQPKVLEKESEKLSDGEISDRSSSEVEAVELKPEVVCISDEENGKGKKKKKEKKSKKDKKSKKEKKSKKLDFRESTDQNFYTENDKEKQKVVETTETPEKLIDFNKDETENKDVKVITVIDITENNDKRNILTHTKTEDFKSISNSDDDIKEIIDILELSDDSEIECTLLSKEPTASEIEALSAKIDEIDRVEVITEEEIKQYENKESLEEIENISWKDRYLDSKKVKNVLNTANILNALRKKNRDLKKKLEESKIEKEVEKEDEEKKDVEEKEGEKEDNNVLEGSIEQYNTLEGSTKYVDPVKEVSGDLKKDAKLLLKMYKKLLKYNDMNKEDNPSKKKKKKKKHKRDAEKKQIDSNREHSDIVSNKEDSDVISNKEQNVLNSNKDIEPISNKECSDTV